MVTNQAGERYSCGDFDLSAAQKAVRRSVVSVTRNRKPVLSNRFRQLLPVVFPALVTVLLLGGSALGSVTASISGTVRDPSGAAIVGATVTATNLETGIAQTLHTNEQGYYSFQSIPLGHYDVDVQQPGFRPFRVTGLVLDVNSARVVDATLQAGEVKEVITVSSTAVHVETATTQLGEVIGGHEMTSVPLVSRSYTDLLALQPGVSSTSSGIGGGGGGAANTGSNFTAAGFFLTPVSGSLNAGNLSVNGMREGNNGFLLNGATVQESGFGGTSVIPNLDSIAEFRIITNNFDAEYGNYSGGQINVITKSGGNQFHGDLFEFLRNTSVDARNYFDPARATYHQNQFGGTLGGPIKNSKIFFFGDYQGNRVVQGISSGLIPVPSVAERGGDFSQVLNTSGQNAMIGKTVNGTAWASQLSGELGYPVAAGENYFIPGCTTATCVFPGAQIPAAAISSISTNLLKYIPTPNNGAFFSTAGLPNRLRDDKTSGRIDGGSRFGMLSAYYFFDDYTLNNPYTVASSLPGFASLSTGKIQVINLSDAKTIGNAAANEFRFQFVRSRNFINASGGNGVTLSSLGFTGITPLDPAVEGVPEIDFNSFQFGTLSRIFGLTENTFQWLDNYRKLVGKHTLSLGGSYHYTQQQERLRNVENGNFQFFGTETGIDFADFLLGAPTSYVQGQTPPYNGRSRYMGLYGQDSWRVASQLTLNYGLRWEFDTPWYEQHNEVNTLVPGLQSNVFPNAPTGYVFPGDPGIPSTLAPTRYDNFAPRVGLAYSPNGGDGWLGKLTGAGQTSIRAGYGLFYTAFEGASSFNEIGEPPFGAFFVPSNPTFTNPFVNRSNGTSSPSPFPIQVPPPQSINFASAGFLPLTGTPGFYYKNRLPYAEEYELSIQRQFSSSTLLTLSYVGTQGHRLFSTMEANPGSPAICNYLNANGATPSCGPNGESGTTYVLPAGVAPPPGSGSIATTAPCTNGSGTCNAVPGTRTVFGPKFTSVGYFITNGQSSYNSLQINLRHTAKSLTFLAGYTFSKSLDDSSAYGEQVNPLDPRLSRALSAFDQTHNFVFSYAYNLPLDKLGGPKRLTGGWQLSGITRFATGVPVTLYETNDNSLLGTAFSGPLPIGIDTPLFTGTSVHLENPRTTGNYFDASQFVNEPVGTLGSRRRFFHGPGLNNWDMALLKDTPLNERTRLEFRAEFFNLFNHAQFNAANGNINNATFGSVLSAQPSRIGQLSLKLLF